RRRRARLDEADLAAVRDVELVPIHDQLGHELIDGEIASRRGYRRIEARLVDVIGRSASQYRYRARRQLSAGLRRVCPAAGKRATERENLEDGAHARPQRRQTGVAAPPAARRARVSCHARHSRSHAQRIKQLCPHPGYAIIRLARAKIIMVTRASKPRNSPKASALTRRDARIRYEVMPPSEIMIEHELYVFMAPLVFQW